MEIINKSLEKLDGVYKQNELNTSEKKLLDKNGNKLLDIYKQLDKEVPNEDIYDKFGKLLSADPELNLLGIEMFDINGIKYSGLYRNSSLDTLVE